MPSRRVLVTGADGFIGSHLVEELVAAGEQVRALAQYNSFNSWGWLDTLPPSVRENVEVVTGDIRDAYFVRNIVAGLRRRLSPRGPDCDSLLVRCSGSLRGDERRRNAQCTDSPPAIMASRR